MTEKKQAPMTLSQFTGELNQRFAKLEKQIAELQRGFGVSKDSFQTVETRLDKEVHGLRTDVKELKQALVDAKVLVWQEKGA